jgi:hypothetical protein
MIALIHVTVRLYSEVQQVSLMVWTARPTSDWSRLDGAVYGGSAMILP